MCWADRSCMACRKTCAASLCYTLYNCHLLHCRKHGPPSSWDEVAMDNIPSAHQGIEEVDHMGARDGAGSSSNKECRSKTFCEQKKCALAYSTPYSSVYVQTMKHAGGYMHVERCQPEPTGMTRWVGWMHDTCTSGTACQKQAVNEL